MSDKKIYDVASTARRPASDYAYPRLLAWQATSNIVAYFSFQKEI
jgi:hypothetical protein